MSKRKKAKGKVSRKGTPPNDELKLFGKALIDPAFIKSFGRGLADLKAGRTVPYVRRTKKMTLGSLLDLPLKDFFDLIQFNSGMELIVVLPERMRKVSGS